MNKKEFDRWQELDRKATEKILEITEYWYEVGYQKFPEFVSHFGLNPCKMTDPLEDCFIKVDIDRDLFLKVYVTLLPEGCNDGDMLDPMLGTCVEFSLKLVYDRNWKEEVDKLIEARIAEIEKINEEDEKNSMEITMVSKEEYKEYEKWRNEQ